MSSYACRVLNGFTSGPESPRRPAPTAPGVGRSPGRPAGSGREWDEAWATLARSRRRLGSTVAPVAACGSNGLQHVCPAHGACAVTGRDEHGLAVCFEPAARSARQRAGEGRARLVVLGSRRGPLSSSIRRVAQQPPLVWTNLDTRERLRLAWSGPGFTRQTEDGTLLIGIGIYSWNRDPRVPREGAEAGLWVTMGRRVLNRATGEYRIVGRVVDVCEALAP